MARMVKGLYVAPDCVKVCEVDDRGDCEAYYELLGCRMIEAPDFYVKLPDRAPEQSSGEYFDFICDEEALCKGTIPACTVAYRESDGAVPWIHGPCFICKANEDGEWVSCSEEELKALKSLLCVYQGDFMVVLP